MLKDQNSVESMRTINPRSVVTPPGVTTSETKSKKKGFPFKGKVSKPTLVLGALLIAVSVVAIYFFAQYQLTKNDSVLSDAEAKQIREETKAHIILEDLEKYSVGVIKGDKELENLKLANPTFFKNAQSRDVLLFTDNQGIIFRRSNGLIVNIGQITNNADVVRVDVRRRDEKTEFTDTEKKITAIGMGFSVVNKSKAGAKVDGPRVVNLSLFDKAKLDKLREVFKVPFEDTLPEGESNPLNADVIVFI